MPRRKLTRTFFYVAAIFALGVLYAVARAAGTVCYLQCKSCFYEEKVYFGMGVSKGYITGYCSNCKKFVSRIVADKEDMRNAAPEFMCPLCGTLIRRLDEVSLRKKLRAIPCPKCGSKRLQVQDRYEWE